MKITYECGCVVMTEWIGIHYSGMYLEKERRPFIPCHKHKIQEIEERLNRRKEECTSALKDLEQILAQEKSKVLQQ